MKHTIYSSILVFLSICTTQLLLSQEPVNKNIKNVELWLTTPSRVEYTPLQKAILREDIDTVKHLLLRCTDIDAENNHYVTALHIAVDQCSTEIVQLLLQAGANPNARIQREGTMPYILEYYTRHKTTRNTLAQSQNSHIIKYVNRKGLSTTRRNNAGATPLHIAADKGKTDIVKLLLEYNATPNAQDAELCTPLHNAALQNHTETTTCLLEHGANQYKKNISDISPIGTALLYDYVDTLRILINYKNEYYENFINLQPNISTYKDFLTRWLSIAALHKKPQSVIALINEGADVHYNIFEKDIWNLLFHNLTENNYHAFKKIMLILLQNGIDPNIKDTGGMPPVQRAFGYSDWDSITMLLDYEADPNTPVSTRKHPQRIYSLLHVFQNPHQAKTIILSGGNCNARDYRGSTPLHIAAGCGQYQTAKILIENGADLYAQDRDGQTALDVARISDQNIIANMIEQTRENNTNVEHTLKYLTNENVKQLGAQPTYAFDHATTTQQKMILLGGHPDILYYHLYHQKNNLFNVIETIRQEYLNNPHEDCKRNYVIFLKACIILATGFGDEHIITTLGTSIPIQNAKYLISHLTGNNRTLKPIHAAAERGNPAIFKRLIQLGANPNDTSCSETPSECALKNNNTAIGRIIRDYNVRSLMLDRAFGIHQHTDVSMHDQTSAAPGKRTRKSIETTNKKQKLNDEKSATKTEDKEITHIPGLPSEMIDNILKISMTHENTLTTL